MLSVVLLLATLTWLLTVLALYLRGTEGMRWRLVRGFLYVLAVLALATGIGILNVLAWISEPTIAAPQVDLKWRYVLPAACLFWLAGAAFLGPRAGRWPPRLVFGLFSYGFLGWTVLLISSFAWTAREIRAARLEAERLVEEVVPEALPEEQNVAAVYEEVVASFKDDPEQPEVAKALLDGVFCELWHEGAPEPAAEAEEPESDEEDVWDPRRFPSGEVERLLARHADDIARLHEAAVFPGRGIELDGERDEVLEPAWPSTLHELDLHHVLLEHARQRIEAGKPEEALKDVRALLAVSDQLVRAGPPYLLRFAVGCAYVGHAIQPLEAALAHPALAAADLDALGPVDEVDYDRLLEPVLRVEAAMSLAQAARTATEASNAPVFGFPLERGGDLYRILHLSDDLAEVRERIGEARARLARGFPKGLDPPRAARPAPIRTSGMIGLAEALPGAAEATAYRRLLRAGLAMHRFRLAEGRSPGRLEDLVPRFLEAVPLDPFDGRPLKLKGEAGGAWTLYSVGPDRADDGGTRGELDMDLGGSRGDIVFTSRPAAR
ncbi:MAG: hypothetical protein HY721_09475 [Planctomycetes bacterium]|nr:hypothetical protein [Planctomycetota bacterium]